MPIPNPDSQTQPARKSRGKAVAAVAVLAAAGIAVAVWRARDDGPRDEALALSRQGDFDRAEPLLKQSLGRAPDDVEVLNSLARGYVKSERYAEAVPYLSKLIELRPGNTEYLRQRFEAYRHLKDDERAFADAEKLTDLDPTDLEVRRSATTVAFAVGRFAEAENHCRAVLSDRPKDRRFRMLLSHIRKARGDDQAAGDILDDLIRDDPNDYGALLARGTLYDETGHSEQAIPLLRRVFDNDRSRRRTSGYQLGMALGKAGRKEEAEKVLSEVRRLQDVELFDTAMQNRPDDLDLKVRLAQNLINDGHTADGIMLLEAVLAKSPGHAGANLALAVYYEKNGNPERAAEHRRRAGKRP